MIIPISTKERIFNALMEGWSFRYPKEPFGKIDLNNHFTNQGSIWISNPKDPSGWVCYKSDTKNWLDECLDQAGVKREKKGR